MGQANHSQERQGDFRAVRVRHASGIFISIGQSAASWNPSAPERALRMVVTCQYFFTTRVNSRRDRDAAVFETIPQTRQVNSSLSCLKHFKSFRLSVPAEFAGFGVSISTRNFREWLSVRKFHPVMLLKGRRGLEWTLSRSTDRIFVSLSRRPRCLLGGRDNNGNVDRMFPCSAVKARPPRPADPVPIGQFKQE
jgi:hypothetical protein